MQKVSGLFGLLDGIETEVDGLPVDNQGEAEDKKQEFKDMGFLGEEPVDAHEQHCNNADRPGKLHTPPLLCNRLQLML
jgi:hypothetical protein